MKGLLTYERFINLLAVYYYHNDWETQTIDYMYEKYSRIFSSYPDKILINNNIIYPITLQSDLKVFQSRFTVYKIKWRYDTKDIPPQMEAIIFFIFLMTSKKPFPKNFVKTYSLLFTSYDLINQNSQVFGLHELNRQTIERYEIRFADELLIYKRCSKIKRLMDRM
jgi:hypothetical protein